MPLQTPHDLGNLIQARRQAMGLSQAALADRVGVSRLWVNELERGNPGAGFGLILRTLNVLNIALTTVDIAPKPTNPPPPVQAPDPNAVLAAILQR